MIDVVDAEPRVRRGQHVLGGRAQRAARRRRGRWRIRWRSTARTSARTSRSGRPSEAGGGRRRCRCPRRPDSSVQGGGRAGVDADAADGGRACAAAACLPAFIRSTERSSADLHARRAQCPLGARKSLDLAGMCVGRLPPTATPPVPRSPLAKSPFATNTLDGQEISANSRFLTKCYLLIAVKAPQNATSSARP